jgi:hypothetical protein
MKQNRKKTILKTKNKIIEVFSRCPPSNMSVPRLIRNKRAVNAVISNMILIAAVVVVGFAVLAWAQTQSSQYQQAQTGIVNKDINQLQERLSFEYIAYSDGTLTVYIMNTGSIGNVNVTSVQIGSDTPAAISNLYTLSGTQVSSLNTGQDGYFTVPKSLTQGTNYSIKVITSRGSSFVSTFAA